jgi:TetR/AcrR family transcriptional repressor of lmrAB and yxaGH operons
LRRHSDKPMSKQTYVPILLKLFRQFGYEGVTLSKISQETGLGKASLYHHFPRGKAEMAETALNYVNNLLETRILEILKREDPPISKFQAMFASISNFFNEGQSSCLWSVLVMQQSSDDLFHEQIKWAFSLWIEAIAEVLVNAGLPDQQLARERAEDAMISIQGALILAHGLRDTSPFKRVMERLPHQLCRDLPRNLPSRRLE